MSIVYNQEAQLTYFVGHWNAFVDRVSLVNVGFVSQIERISITAAIMMRKRCTLNHWGCMMICTAVMTATDVSNIQAVNSISVSEI